LGKRDEAIEKRKAGEKDYPNWFNGIAVQEMAKLK